MVGEAPPVGGVPAPTQTCGEEVSQTPLQQAAEMTQPCPSPKHRVPPVVLEGVTLQLLSLLQ